MTKRTVHKAKREVKTAMQRAGTPLEAKAVLEESLKELEPTVAAYTYEAKPGQIIAGQKRAWTEADLAKEYGVTEFVPEVTKAVTLQGVRFQLFQGVSMAVPTEVYNIYLRAQRATREAGRTLPDLGYKVDINLGAGALEPQ